MVDDYREDDEEHMEEGESLIKPLPEDHDPPFSEPTDPIVDAAAQLEIREASGHLNPTNEVTDDASDIDSHELYDEGLSGAVGASEPNEGNTVIRYDPSKDRRKR